MTLAESCAVKRVEDFGGDLIDRSHEYLSNQVSTPGLYRQGNRGVPLVLTVRSHH